MLFNGKTINDLKESDLIDLIGRESESDRIDYKKAAYPAYSDKEGKRTGRAEFCADLTSFANTNGGWIVCGMIEENGEAKELCGLGTEINPDAEIRRLRQVADSGIEPRIPGLQIRDITLNDPQKSKAIVIYIPQSFAKPHRVKDDGKFWMRRSNGKLEMDLNELRQAF